MRTGLTKQEKTTDIYFDEKDPHHLHPHPQHRPQKQADRIQPQTPCRLQADGRRPGHGLQGI